MSGRGSHEGSSRHDQVVRMDDCKALHTHTPDISLYSDITNSCARERQGTSRLSGSKSWLSTLFKLFMIDVHGATTGSSGSKARKADHWTSSVMAMATHASATYGDRRSPGEIEVARRAVTFSALL